MKNEISDEEMSKLNRKRMQKLSYAFISKIFIMAGIFPFLVVVIITLLARLTYGYFDIFLLCGVSSISIPFLLIGLSCGITFRLYVKKMNPKIRTFLPTIYFVLGFAGVCANFIIQILIIIS